MSNKKITAAKVINKSGYCKMQFSNFASKF